MSGKESNFSSFNSHPALKQLLKDLQSLKGDADLRRFALMNFGQDPENPKFDTELTRFKEQLVKDTKKILRFVEENFPKDGEIHNSAKDLFILADRLFHEDNHSIKLFALIEEIEDKSHLFEEMVKKLL